MTAQPWVIAAAVVTVITGIVVIVGYVFRPFKKVGDFIRSVHAMRESVDEMRVDLTDKFAAVDKRFDQQDAAIFDTAQRAINTDKRTVWVEGQLKPNGGSSLRDVANRTENAVAGLTGRLDEHVRDHP